MVIFFFGYQIDENNMSVEFDENRTSEFYMPNEFKKTGKIIFDFIS